MAIDLYLRKPSRACGSTFCISKIIKRISLEGPVLLISQTDLACRSLRYYQFNNNVKLAHKHNLHTFRGFKFLAIFVLDIWINNDFYSKLLESDEFYYLRYDTDYIFYEVMEDMTKGYKSSGNEIYNP